MKLPRAIRLDDSDLDVFETAAEPGEWCVPGAFCFLDDDESTLVGKRAQAFQGGFLAIGSFGFTTLAQVTDADDDDMQHAIDVLAHHLLKEHGAPHLAAALPAAAAELHDAAEACAYAPGTLLAIERELTDEGVVERLKAFTPTAGGHDNLRLWGLDTEGQSS